MIAEPMCLGALADGAAVAVTYSDSSQKAAGVEGNLVVGSAEVQAAIFDVRRKHVLARFEPHPQ
jgi:hypothetical protein